MGRAYKEKDLKILWGAHAICAHPDCRERLVVPATADDEAKVIGKISHIVAHSDNGPRGDPAFPKEDREKPENLILLCGTHHDKVDVQPNTYTSEELRRWRRDHEEWVRNTLADAIVALTFDELDKVATALVASPPQIAGALVPPTPPARKMQHNDLTVEVAHYYQIGQLRFADIETFIGNAASWDVEFGNRLKAGFQAQYDALWQRGVRGDDLYVALAHWAQGGSLAPFKRQAAGVAILSYLFHVCDVFEPEPDR